MTVKLIIKFYSFGGIRDVLNLRDSDGSNFEPKGRLTLYFFTMNVGTSWSQSIVPYKVNAVLDSFFYYPDFIDPEMEQSLLMNIYSVPRQRWQLLGHRRLQIWGGTPHPNGMIAEGIPKWLVSLMNKVSDLGVFGPYRANHVLINEYKPGQGIMPHHDGNLYFPVVTTVNLGSHGVLDFYRPVEQSKNAALRSRYMGSALLMPRSLNVVGDLMYTHFMHGIEEKDADIVLPTVSTLHANIAHVPKPFIFNSSNVPYLKQQTPVTLPRETRVSVTIRYVPNTRKLNTSRIFGKSMA